VPTAPFFAWYNQQNRHSGIAMLMPECVHTGRAAEVRRQRQATLQSAFERTPNRFRTASGTGFHSNTSCAAWINPPVMEKKAASYQI
jgi:putative transposase